MILADSHCHIAGKGERKNSFFGALAGRAAEVGEQGDGCKIAAGVCLHDSRLWGELSVFDLRREVSKLSAGAAWELCIGLALGFHPRFLDGTEDFPLLERALQSCGASAVGETGLDYSVSIPKELQKKAFLRHLEIAGKLGLPVVLHSVRAHADILDIMESFSRSGGKICGVMLHAARASSEIFKRYEKFGALFSFGERELSNEKIAAAAAALPGGSICFESDSDSFNPGVAARAAGMLADKMGICQEKLLEKSAENIKKFFR